MEYLGHWRQPCPWETVEFQLLLQGQGFSGFAKEEDLPGLKVMLKITTLHYLSTVLSERAGHHELVEELMD